MATKEKEKFEPSDRQKKVLQAFGGAGKPKTIAELAEIAFAREHNKVRQNSWVRNQLRGLKRHKLVKKVKPGVYERLSASA